MSKLMYDVISPDGFPINHEGWYETFEEAEIALDDFVARFVQQGYYSSVNYGRIAIEYIKLHCNIVLVDVITGEFQDAE
jgi:hypothetical protein